MVREKAEQHLRENNITQHEYNSYIEGAEFGANYVLDVITGVLNQPMNDYLMLKEVWNTIRELKNQSI